MGIVATGITDIGLKRKTNQDAIYVNSKDHLYVVADGMGGHNGGDIASALAVKHMPEYFFAHKSDALTQESISQHLIQSVTYANRAILNEANKRPELKGMGTTIVGMYFNQTNLYITNVGDSRCYLVNDGQLFQLTRDHSLVQEKINMGIYSREEAVEDLMKNVLVRTVGYEDDLEVDIFSYKVSKNDLFILCSDGLHSKVSDKDILTIIQSTLDTNHKNSKEELQKAAEALVQQANANGGNDNISIILTMAQ